MTTNNNIVVTTTINMTTLQADVEHVTNQRILGEAATAANKVIKDAGLDRKIAYIVAKALEDGLQERAQELVRVKLAKRLDEEVDKAIEAKLPGWMKRKVKEALQRIKD